MYCKSFNAPLAKGAGSLRSRRGSALPSAPRSGVWNCTRHARARRPSACRLRL